MSIALTASREVKTMLLYETTAELNAAVPLDGGLIYEYSQAADPIAAGCMPVVPYASFPARLHAEGATQVIPLDLSAQLGCQGPATSPALSANFLHILPGESVTVNPNASSQLYFVMRGSGTTRFGETTYSWDQGDVFALPTVGPVNIEASADAALYWVHDEPLLTYLGATAHKQTFRPALYRKDISDRTLAKVASDPQARKRSRLSILLASKDCEQTRTITPTLWAMLGIVPPGNVQLPHRHQSVALDLIIDCQPNCYTLVGKECDAAGVIIDPVRVEWQPHSVFVTPPGYWHAHYNESNEPAYLLPIQDAGLQSYLRALDIRFS